MPAVIPIIVTAISTYSGVIAAGYAISTAIAITAAVTVLGLVSTQLSKPKGAKGGGIEDLGIQNRTITGNQPVPVREVIYGQVRTGGVYGHKSETEDKYLHVIYLLACHQIKSVLNIYIDDLLITPEMIDSTGMVMMGRFKNKCRIKIHLGEDAQTVDSDYLAEVIDAASTDKFSGTAYVYIRYEFDTEVYPNGEPTASFDAQGKLLYDTRDAGTRYSENPFLATNDYLINQRYGRKLAQAKVDSTSFNACANTSDEMVTTTSQAQTATPADISYSVDVDEATDKLTISDAACYTMPFITEDTVTITADSLPGGLAAATTYYVIVVDAWNIKLATSSVNAAGGTAINITSAGSVVKINKTGAIPVYPAADMVALDDDTSKFCTGDRAQVTTSGSLPTGLSLSTNYYLIVSGSRIKPRIRFGTSLANAYAGTAINLTTRGTGTLTITKNAEPRYTANGKFLTNVEPYVVLDKLGICSAGGISNVGGLWYARAGVYSAPVVSYDENDYIAPLEVVTKYGRRDRFNSVKGVYYSPFLNDQADDYPAISPAAYITEDNDVQLFLDLDLPFTNRSNTCQRIGYIVLNKHRFQRRATIITGLKGLKNKVGDTIYLNYERRNWVNKEFEVTDWEFSLTSDGGVPVIQIKMNVQETASSVYSFNPATDEILPAAPKSFVNQNAFLVEAPVNLSADSGTDQLEIPTDGTVISRILIQWDAPTGNFVRGTSIEYKKSTDTDYTSIQVFQPSNYLYLSPVVDGEIYNIRVRHFNDINKFSTYVTLAPHTVVGKTEKPQDVPFFTIFQTGGACVAQWDSVTDSDLGGYEIRYGATTADWDSLDFLTRKNAGTELTTLAAIPGEHLFCIKAVDTSGNFSENAVCQVLEVVSDFDIISSRTNHAIWSGTLENFIINPITGDLVPDDQLAASGNDFNIFDTFVTTPYTTYSFTDTEYDVGTDVVARLYNTIEYTYGADVTGTIDIEGQIDYKITSGAYDGFERAALVGIVPMRYFKNKIVMDGTGALACIQQFTTVADAQAREETGTATIASGGSSTSITFDTPFINEPFPSSLVVVGTGGLIFGDLVITTTGFSGKIFDTGGSSVGGTLSWTFTGV